MYIWRVFQNNRFAGYVSAPSQFNAYVKANEEYGQNVWVEKTVEYKVVYNPNNQDHFVGDSQPA
jgi:hypothetical protein